MHAEIGVDREAFTPLIIVPYPESAVKDKKIIIFSIFEEIGRMSLFYGNEQTIFFKVIEKKQRL